jgi:hypothetical protein
VRRIAARVPLAIRPAKAFSSITVRRLFDQMFAAGADDEISNAEIRTRAAHFFIHA